MKKEEYIEEILEITSCLVEVGKDEYKDEVLTPRLKDATYDEVLTALDSYSAQRLRGMHNIAITYLGEYNSLRQAELQEDIELARATLKFLEEVEDSRGHLVTKFRDGRSSSTIVDDGFIRPEYNCRAATGHILVHKKKVKVAQEIRIEWEGQPIKKSILEDLKEKQFKALKERRKLGRLIMRYLGNKAPCMRDDLSFSEELRNLEKRWIKMIDLVPA